LNERRQRLGWIVGIGVLVALAVAVAVFAKGRTSRAGAPSQSSVETTSFTSTVATQSAAGPNGQQTTSVVDSKPTVASNPHAPQPRVNQPAPPKPTQLQLGLPDGVAPPSGSVTFLPLKDFKTSQTYRVNLAVVGWQNKETGMLVGRVASAGLLGPISAATGDPMGPPPSGAIDYGPRFKGLTVLATTNPKARESLVQQKVYSAYLVLLPSGGGAVFVLDKVL
jgi:hypothetical protein